MECCTGQRVKKCCGIRWVQCRSVLDENSCSAWRILRWSGSLAHIRCM